MKNRLQEYNVKSKYVAHSRWCRLNQNRIKLRTIRIVTPLSTNTQLVLQLIKPCAISLVFRSLRLNSPKKFRRSSPVFQIIDFFFCLLTNKKCFVHLVCIFRITYSVHGAIWSYPGRTQNRAHTTSIQVLLPDNTIAGGTIHTSNGIYMYIYLCRG